MGVPPLGGGDEGRRTGKGGGVHYSETEHGRTIHCNAYDYGVMLGGGAAAGSTVIKNMVITGGDLPCWGTFVRGDGSSGD